jgi:hypothetical protein
MGYESVKLKRGAAFAVERLRQPDHTLRGEAALCRCGSVLAELLYRQVFEEFTPP